MAANHHVRMLNRIYGYLFLLFLTIECSEINRSVRGFKDSYDVIHLDDDLEVHQPKQRKNRYPQVGEYKLGLVPPLLTLMLLGREFEVWIRLKQKYGVEYDDLESKEYQKLRTQLQKNILNIYVEDQTYIDTLVLGFTNVSDELVAKLLVRFSTNATGHLGLLSQHCIAEDLGGLPVYPIFLHAEVANYEKLYSILCDPKCKQTASCPVNCNRQCCTMQIVVPTIVPQIVPIMNQPPVELENEMRIEQQYPPRVFPDFIQKTPPKPQAYQEAANYILSMPQVVPQPAFNLQPEQISNYDPLWKTITMPDVTQHCSEGCRLVCSPPCSLDCCSQMSKYRRSRIAINRHRKR